MTDVHDRKTRSYNMSRIKSKDTKPELLVRKFLFSTGFRYRLHDKKLPGKPDIILSKYKTVIFVHGCFWHGHKNCRYFCIPKTRSQWWNNKIEINKNMDRLHGIALKKANWKIIYIWTCELKPKKVLNTLHKLTRKLSV